MYENPNQLRESNFDNMDKSESEQTSEDHEIVNEVKIPLSEIKEKYYLETMDRINS
jgi:sortase (surface protein transpeptidase)